MAIGLGLAVAFVGGGYGLQVAITKGPSALAPALMVGSMLLRLLVLAAVVIPLGLYTDLNLIALLAAFVVVFTVLQVWVISIQVKRSNKEAQAAGAPAAAGTAVSKAAKTSKGA